MKSSKAVQEDAMRRFKEVSEAYDVLGDDKKRAAYKYARTTTGFYHNNNSSAYRRGEYSNNSTYGGGYDSTYQRRASWSRAWDFRVGSSLLYFSSMNFLLHAVIVGFLMGSLYVADATGKAIWQKQNRGKSFEETMDAINRKKAERLDSTQKEEDKKEM
ncbi:chaperone protein dnaJ 72 isoform X4 [Cryptomeria japonica]|nr:chaperone protein dnaJ 72 isoform X4 [Cryptomeria japonica]